MLAPIALFVYNRPLHARQTVEALLKNTLAAQSDLIIFSDAPKTEVQAEAVSKVRQYIHQIDGFKSFTVVERKANFGLAKSIIDGVTSIVNEHGRIIVLEDDLITSPYFLRFMNDGLNAFEQRQDICSITGFSFPSKIMKFPKGYNENIYLNIRPMSWSWATWQDRWDGIDWSVKDYKDFISDVNKIKKFNQGGTDLTGMLMAQMNGRLDSWYIRWCYNQILNDKLTIYPRISFVNNLGFDNTGVHCGIDKSNKFSHRELNKNGQLTINGNIKIDLRVIRKFNKNFNITFKSRIKSLIKKILGYLLKSLKIFGL